MRDSWLGFGTGNDPNTITYLNSVYRLVMFICPAGVTKISKLSMVINSISGSCSINDYTVQVYNVTSIGGVGAVLSAAPTAFSGSIAVGNLLTATFAGNDHTLTPGTRYCIVIKNSNTSPNPGTNNVSIRGFWTPVSSPFNTSWSTTSGKALPDASYVYTAPDSGGVPGTLTSIGAYAVGRFFKQWVFDDGTEWGMGIIEGTTSSNASFRSVEAPTLQGVLWQRTPLNAHLNVASVTMRTTAIAGSHVMKIKFENGMLSNGFLEFTVCSTDLLITYSNFTIPTPGLILPAGGETKITLTGGDSTNYASSAVTLVDTQGVNIPTWVAQSRATIAGVEYIGCFLPFRFNLDGETPLMTSPYYYRRRG